jgi:hypothetical protein
MLFKTPLCVVAVWVVSLYTTKCSADDSSVRADYDDDVMAELERELELEAAREYAETQLHERDWETAAAAEADAKRAELRAAEEVAAKEAASSARSRQPKNTMFQRGGVGTASMKQQQSKRDHVGGAAGERSASGGGRSRVPKSSQPGSGGGGGAFGASAGGSGGPEESFASLQAKMATMQTEGRSAQPGGRTCCR